MNFDNIIVTKHLGKDNLCLDYLQQYASYPKEGVKQYQLNKKNKITISHNEILNTVKVNANIPYCFLGHNFHSTIGDFTNGFQSISEDLNVNLFEAEVNSFEFGSFIEIPFPVKNLLNNHVKANNMKARIFESGKDFTPVKNQTHRIKLYDGGYRLKTELSKGQREMLTNDFGYKTKANYLKLECNYLKPETYFKQRNLKLSNLFTSSFTDDCKSDLLTNYQKIMKTGNIIIPDTKSKLTSSVIPLICLKELGQIYGFSPEDAIKKLLQSIPDEILTKHDKKARKRQIANNLKLIQPKGKSMYDVSDLIEAKANIS